VENGVVGRKVFIKGWIVNMKKHFLLAICIVLVLCVSGCSGQGKPIPILSDTSEDFDLNTAINMVQELERPTLEFKSGGTFSRSELEELQNEYELFAKESPVNVLTTFFDTSELEDTSKLELEVLDKYRYPTIFDEDIKLDKAYVRTIVYDLGNNMTETKIRLFIEQKYVGENSDMKRFYRDYVFTPVENGDWVLSGIDGYVNAPLDGKW